MTGHITVQVTYIHYQHHHYCCQKKIQNRMHILSLDSLQTSFGANIMKFDQRKQYIHKSKESTANLISRLREKRLMKWKDIIMFIFSVALSLVQPPNLQFSS